jgi:hypothetical protein
MNYNEYNELVNIVKNNNINHLQDRICNIQDGGYDESSVLCNFVHYYENNAEDYMNDLFFDNLDTQTEEAYMMEGGFSKEKFGKMRKRIKRPKGPSRQTRKDMRTGTKKYAGKFRRSWSDDKGQKKLDTAIHGVEATTGAVQAGTEAVQAGTQLFDTLARFLQQTQDDTQQLPYGTPPQYPPPKPLPRQPSDTPQWQQSQQIPSQYSSRPPSDTSQWQQSQPYGTQPSSGTQIPSTSGLLIPPSKPLPRPPRKVDIEYYRKYCGTKTDQSNRQWCEYQKNTFKQFEQLGMDPYNVAIPTGGARNDTITTIRKVFNLT